MSTMSLSLFERLHRCPGIFEALDEAVGGELEIQKQLRARYPAELVRGACTISELRRRAAGKFSHSEQMWFDRMGLEQSTHEAVAKHKAQRFEGCVWDLCCGIGGDSLALGERGDVVAMDIDPVRARCTAWNAEVYDVADRVNVSAGDMLAHEWGGRLVHIDPDRRSKTGTRARRIEHYTPGLETLHELTARASGGAIKVSPASNFDRHFADCEVEIVSLHGECKVATVWFGSLASEHGRRATILPAGVSLVAGTVDAATESRRLGNYLYDPDPAVVRAGLVNTLVCVLDIGRLDDAEEYLTSDTCVSSPFVRRYIVEASYSADEKRLRRWLQGLNIGRLEIKSRRLPIDHESLRRRLRLKGDDEATLVFARVAGATTAVLCRPDSRCDIADR